MKDIVIEAMKGNDQAFYDLIYDNREALYKIAWQYLRDEASCKEAIQEVTCRAYLKLKQLKHPEFFLTWLNRILINYCLDEMKRNKRFEFMDESFEVSECDSEENWSMRIDLIDCIKRLRTDHRDVIILRYYEGLTTEEIAKALNKPVGTVKTWLNRGLKQMRSLLKGCEEYV